MPRNKLFVIKKYIYASSAFEAIKKDKKTQVDEIWVDDDWKKANTEKEGHVGFKPKVDKKKKVI